MKSLMARPNKHSAGDSLVSLSGQLRYWSMALWKVSTSSSPRGPVLSAIMRFTVFTLFSALQLLCGNATAERRWWTPHDLRNFCVELAVNSGPPPDANSMPYVLKCLRRTPMRPDAPSEACSTIGQLVY